MEKFTLKQPYNYKTAKNIFMLDVESTSLHGQAFAVGAVVMRPDGVIIDQFELRMVIGTFEANDWVKENVLPAIQNMPSTPSLASLLSHFKEFYMKHYDTCEFWGDCIYPVETNFLSQMVTMFPDLEWKMPYPLNDLATLLDVNVDRAKFTPNKAWILRPHHPLHDANVSASCLYRILTGIPF